MDEKLFLVKISSEIHLKSNYVRKRFTRQLINNIRIAAKNKKIQISKISRSAGRLYIYIDKNQIKRLQKILLNIFGVHSVALAEHKKFSTLDELSHFIVNFAKTQLKKNSTFAVRVTRDGQHFFSSKDVEIVAGARILKDLKKLNLKVRLEKADKTIFVEIRDNDVYLYTDEKPGLLGLPLGTEGNVLLSFTGTKDDLLAAFLMMKRGCKIFPFIDKNKNKSKKILKKLKKFNLYNDFNLIKMDELENAKRKYNLQALVISERKLKNNRTEMFGLPILRPLLFYPKHFYEKNLKLL